MATLTNVFNRFFIGSEEQSAAQTRAAFPQHGPSARLRSFPNEDIYFYTKRIDNTDVIREADPKASGACWKMIGTAGAAVVLLIGVLLPSAYGLLAGFQIQSLRQEGERLATEQASLELQEARLLSPARMEELARIQQFIDPEPQKVVYLDSAKGGGSLAMNHK